jgi:hypothetical protein
MSLEESDTEENASSLSEVSLWMMISSGWAWSLELLTKKLLMME